MIDESSRHRLRQKLEEVLGERETEALMAYLPPLGWGDVATKADLEHLREKMEFKFEAVLERRLGAQTRTFIFAMVGTFIAFAGVVLAAAGIS